jgi:very-short-patch-repair endonuclease
MPDRGYARPTARSRELRATMTDAERKLWTCLNARKVAGVRFNRQFPIGPFICDFVSRSAKLVIEVDGGQHDVERDAARTRFIESQGYCVVRFWDDDMLQRTEGVVSEIERVLKDRPSPNPSRKREGDDEQGIAPHEVRSREGEFLSAETEPTPCR